jgi:hypothetical protein
MHRWHIHFHLPESFKHSGSCNISSREINSREQAIEIEKFGKSGFHVVLLGT